MAILKDSDLFDFDRYRQQLADTGAAAIELAQSTEVSATRMKGAYAGTISQLEQIKTGLSNLSSAQVQQATQAVTAFDKQVDTLARDAEKYRALLKQMDDQQSASSFSLKEMATLLNGLEREYKSLKPDQADYVARQKEILDKTRAVSTVLSAQTQVFREAKRATDAAEGSYTHLSQQTNQLRQALRNLPDAFDKVTGAINKHNQVAVDMHTIIERNDRVLKSADASMGQHQRNVGNYGGALRGMGSDALFAIGGIIGVSSAFDAIKMGLGVISDMDRVNSSLRAVSKDTADFNHTQQFLIATADQLGLSYDVLARSFKGLKAATNGTALEGKQTEQMFTGIVRAGAALKLTNEEVEGAIKALEQMMSKGKITAEELRGQLAERLPGAMKLLAEATGVSEAKLNKMMEQGELLAVDVLPKLAAQLDKTYGADAQKNADSMAGGWNRMTNEVHLFLAAMNENGAIDRFSNNITGMISNTLKGMRAAIQSGEWKTFFGGGLSFSEHAQNSDKINQFRTMTPKQREARIGITQDAIARDEKLLATDYKDSIISSNKMKIERRLEADRKLLVDLRRENLKMIVKDRADADQAEINAQRAADTKKEADEAKAEKDAKKAAAARRKAQSEADRILNGKLTNSKAATGVQLAENANNRQDGLIAEQEFIDKRLSITLAGVAERQAILEKAGRKETDDYKRLAKEKLDAETEHQRDSLKLSLANNKAATNTSLAALDGEGTAKDESYVEKRHQIVVEGIEREQAILTEAGQANSELYRKANQALLDETVDYHSRRIKAAEASWKLELAEVKEGLKAIDTETEQNLTARLNKLQTDYNRQERQVKVAVAKRTITEEEGEMRIYGLKQTYLANSMQAVEDAYQQQELLETELTEARIRSLEEWKTEAIRTPKEILAVEAEIARLRALLDDNLTKERKRAIKEAADFAQEKSDEQTDHEVKNAETAFEKRQKLYQAGLELAGTIGSAIIDVSSANAQRDIDVLDRQKERELNLAGDNADAKARIEEQYAKRKAEIQRKSAEQERAAALFSIAINTAQAVMSVLSTGGGAHYLDFGVSAGILSAFVTAAGIAQAAAVLAKPLPTFWTGTSAAPEGFAELAERGPELRKKQDGSFKYYAQRTVDYLDAGDRIYTADQTSKIVADWQKQQSAQQALQDSMLNNQSTARLREGRQTELRLSFTGGNQLTEAQVERAFTRALDSRPIYVTELGDDGRLHNYVRQGHNETEYLNHRNSLPK